MEALILLGGAAVLLGTGAALILRTRRRREAELAALAAEEAESRSGGVTKLLGSVLKGSVGLLADLVLPPREVVGLADRDGNLTILFCDIAGSVARNVRLGDERWAAVIAEHDRTTERVVLASGGKVLKRQGDGFMAVLPSATAGVRTAAALRESLRDNPEVGEPLPVRIGVHTGPVVDRGDDILGEHVAFAARVAETAAADEILVSAATAAGVDEDVQPLLAAGKQHRLKGLPGRHLLHRVRL